MAMNQADIERLLTNVALEIGVGPSEAGIKAALFDTMKEFLDMSNAWFEWISVPIGPQTQNYVIRPLQGGMITRLICVLDNNNVALPAGISFGIPPGANVPGMPQGQVVSPPGVILTIVYPQNSPITAQALVTKNIILPTIQDGVPDAPDWLLPMYEIAIKEGLLGNMAMQPGKPYTNQRIAQYRLARFRDQTQMAKVAVQRSNIYGGQAWRFPRNFRTSSQRGGVSTPFPSPTSWGI